MITFAYRLDNRVDLLGWEHTRDCAVAARGDLLWSFFPGDIGIATDHIEIMTRFGWVPVLHFAFSMAFISDSLSMDEDAELEYAFTEADEHISFKRRGDLVEIDCSFTEGSVIAPLDEIQLAVNNFTHRLISELGADHPRLLENPAIKEFISSFSD